MYFLYGFIWAFIVGITSYLSFPDSKKRLSISLYSSFIGLVLGGFFSYLLIPAFGFYSKTFLFIGLISLFSLFYSLSVVERTKTAIYFNLSITSLLILLPLISSSPIIYSKEYHSLLKITEQKEFNTSDILFDQSQARFVDQDLASRSASELLGQVRGMGSRYNVGKMSIQKINDELRWIAPFEHSGFFKWVDNSTTPGYVNVSINQYSDAYMTNDNSDINYGVKGFYFNSYLPRYLYQNGYSTTLLEDFTFEVDDTGRAFWVVSIIEPQIGVSGKIATGVVVVDAKSGEINEYKIDETPEWVDRIQPEDIVEELISDWGKYKDGWINSFFVGNNVIEATPGSSIVFTKDGRAKWYTGMQSSSTTNKQSTMGFVLMDSRTGEAVFYERNGITEYAAKNTIEGRVQESAYTSSNPIPYSINGISTFLSILKDQNGNMQGVGLVAYNDRTKVAFGENFDIALRRYISVLTSNGESIDINSDSELTYITANIERSYIQSLDNRLVLNFTLNGEEYKGTFFTASADKNKGAMLTRDNDKVTISVFNPDSEEIQVKEFTNHSFEK